MGLRLFSLAAAGLARVGRLAILVFFKQKAFQESRNIKPNGTLQNGMTELFVAVGSS